ncbi:TRAP transporter small permease [Xanthobacter sediminis]
MIPSLPDSSGAVGLTRAEGAPVLGSLARALAFANRIILGAACLALLAAAVILSYSVASRLAFGATTYWQDEMSVFLLVGATFMTAGYVQSRRGHVAIEALAHMLPPAVNRVRQLAADLFSLAFCAFFSWKSYVLLHEAWVDGQVTSSSWGPPLWIPYGIMTVGMTLLSLQLLLQVAEALVGDQRS